MLDGLDMLSDKVRGHECRYKEFSLGNFIYMLED